MKRDRFGISNVERICSPGACAPKHPSQSALLAAVVEGVVRERNASQSHWWQVAILLLSAVRRIWRCHGLQPHRRRQFKLSNAPNFVGKLRDVVGLSLDLSAYAIDRSLPKKSGFERPTTARRKELPGSLWSVR